MKVNNLNSDIAKLNEENQKLIIQLHKANGALELVSNNMMKEQIRLGLVKQEQIDAKQREEQRQRMLENGRKLINEAKL